MFANVLQDGLEAGVPLDYEALRPLPQRYVSALAEVQQPRLVHWDLSPLNGFFGGNPAFLEGCGMTLPYTPSQSLRRALYNIYLYLIMVIECTYRQYPTDGQEKWARGMLARELDGLK